jgi:hypothetical protein
MKKLLLLLLCVPLIGLGQEDWSSPEKKIFLDEICRTHPLIVELDNSIFGAEGVESFCECISEKITSKYPSKKVLEDKFGIGINFDKEAFGMDILPFFKECAMMKNVDIENTLNIWPDHIKSAFLMGCNNNKDFLESCMSEKKSELECCKCALDATMIMYPDEDDYIDFMMNANYMILINFWGNIAQNCK